MAKPRLRNERGQYLKSNQSSWTDFVEENPYTNEELTEALRDLDTASPIEKAVKAERERLERRYNVQYIIWIIGSGVAVITMYELTKLLLRAGLR
jgi:hypothetical protein